MRYRREAQPARAGAGARRIDLVVRANGSVYGGVLDWPSAGNERRALPTSPEIPIALRPNEQVAKIATCFSSNINVLGPLQSPHFSSSPTLFLFRSLRAQSKLQTLHFAISMISTTCAARGHRATLSPESRQAVKRKRREAMVALHELIRRTAPAQVR